MSAFSLASDFASLVAQWVPGADPAWMATTIMVFVPIWFLGTITGLMLPRPKWLSSSSLSASVLNLGAFKQLALTVHGFFIVRECWYRVFEKGTFRQFLKAVSLWLCGQGWTFDFPHARDPSPELKCMSEGSGLYVTHSDLDLYKTNVKSDAWELMMEKTIPNVFVYKAWRRTLPNGKTEYKSTSICPDATAEEFMDMYLDDHVRPQWDSMISSTEVLESGDFKDRQMVVRWVRKFPFSFISDREYVIARRLFRESDGLYGISKAVDHHLAKPYPNMVKMDVFHSLWRSCTVVCPWGSGKPACETTLLHHEQFKIPEKLARFAAKHGMWGFVQKMAYHVAPFVRARRVRCAPNAIDLHAFGSPEPAPEQIPLHADSSLNRGAGSAPSMRASDEHVCGGDTTDDESDSGYGSEDDEAMSEDDGPAPLLRKKSSMLKGVATFAIAGGLAVIMRKNNCPAPMRTLNRNDSQISAKERFPNNRYRRSMFK